MSEELPSAYPAPPPRTAVLGQLSVGSRWTIAAMLAGAGAVSFILGRSTADDGDGFGQDRFGPSMQGGGFGGGPGGAPVGGPGSLPPGFDAGADPGVPPPDPALEDGGQLSPPGEPSGVEAPAA